MKKNFEIPELVIILFEGDLATDDVVGTSGPGNGYDSENDDWYYN